MLPASRQPLTPRQGQGRARNQTEPCAQKATFTHQGQGARGTLGEVEIAGGAEPGSGKGERTVHSTHTHTHTHPYAPTTHTHKQSCGRSQDSKAREVSKAHQRKKGTPSLQRWAFKCPLSPELRRHIGKLSSPAEKLGAPLQSGRCKKKGAENRCAQRQGNIWQALVVAERGGGRQAGEECQGFLRRGGRDTP